MVIIHYGYVFYIMLLLYLFSLKLQNKQLALAHIIHNFLLNHFCLTSGINNGDTALYHYNLMRKYMALKLLVSNV